jgi:hypothetical protein
MIEARMFFSEEKNQKTFMSLSRVSPAACAQDAKVSCFFSSEKKAFLFPGVQDV